jgi:hypothetical protein
MSDKLQTLLIALGFALVGSAGTALGFALAQRGSLAPAVATGSDDTAPPRAALRSAASRRPELGRGRAAMRERGTQRAGRGQGAGMGPASATRRQRGLAAVADEIDLSAAQRQAWLKMMGDIRTSCADARGAQGDSTLELFSTVATAADPDPEVLHTLIEERLDDQREAAHCVLEEVLEFQAELSPEQRAAIAARVTELKTRRQAWLDAWGD